MVAPTNLVTSSVIKKAEYFFDKDPGVGNGLPLAITSGSPQNNLFSLDISSLAPGFHQLGIRYQDNNGRWTLFTNRTFYFVAPTNLITSSSILKAEYFFDKDPGAGKAQPLTITPGNTQNNNFALDISTLSPGFHQLAIRYKDDQNRWTTFTNRTFYILQSIPVSKTLKKIEYFIDTDPGFGYGGNLIFTPAAQINQQFMIDLTAVPVGAHTLYIRAKDSYGDWSTKASAAFTILNCTQPTAPTAPNGSRCGTGAVNLVAGGATGTQVYRWYADATTTTILFTGATYTTPSISSTTSYFVSIYDPATLCESNRTTVAATIVNIPKPTLNLSGSLAVCSGNTVTLIAPPGFAGYLWSNGLTTQQITLATSGSYSVTVSDGTCTSPASDPFTFTVNPKPAKPTIQGTSGGSLCGGGSVTLTAPTSFSAYRWSSGQTTQSIFVNVPGNFTVSVTDGNGCESVASDVFSVTTTALAKPTVTVTGNTVLCNGSAVTFDAPAGFSGYTWSNGATTKQIVVSAVGNYSVTVSNGPCASPPSDATIVTAATVPPKPVIQIAGPTTLCNTGFVVLSAPAGFSTYAWSDAETTRQIVVSSAGNFSVQVGNAPNCLSVSADPVIVTVTGLPCGSGSTTPPSPSIVNVSRCGPGNVTLTASGATGSQVYRWYDLPVAGTLIFTGTAFTTPSLLITTTYYASIYDPSTSSESNRVTGTVSVVIIAKPSLNVTGTVSICEGSSTLLSAPTGFAQYLWSTSEVTQQIQVTKAGNYSVKTGDGTCLSASSDVTTVSVVPLPSKPVIAIISGSTTFCENGAVTLSGPAGYQYQWSNGATTRSIVITDTNVISLIVKISTGCTSVPSDPLVITRQQPPCKPNFPPVITPKLISAKIEGTATADLTEFVSDPNDNLDYSTLRLLSAATAKGAPASINGNYILSIDYKGIPFAGTDRITISICDLLGLCVQKILEIDVVGEVVVFNGITPDGDGKNDFFYLKYLDVIENAQKNKVSIFNRWGDLVFEITDYNNIDRVFMGNSSNGSELPAGSYFYRIDLVSGKPITGYITLKR